MSDFEIRITPDIPLGEGQPLAKSQALEFEDFEGKNQPRVAMYLFGDVKIGYGESSLYQIYIDICEELDKIEFGGDHDLTMSFYPIVRIIDLKDGFITLSKFSLEQNKSCEYRWSRESIADILLDSKIKIEQFINVLPAS